MSLMVEGVVYSGMDIEKALGGSRRLEPLHLALSSPHNLMEVFSAIILSEASLVRSGEAQLPESRAVGAQLVGDQQLRCEALFPEYFAHQPEGFPVSFHPLARAKGMPFRAAARAPNSAINAENAAITLMHFRR